MLYVKNKTLKENKNCQVSRNAWLHLFPVVTLFPTELEECKFRKIAGVEIAWLHWSVNFYFE